MQVALVIKARVLLTFDWVFIPNPLNCIKIVEKWRAVDEQVNFSLANS